MSVIVSMNGCLGGGEVKAPWCDVDQKSVLSLLQCMFCTLTVAMRYEPTNIKFFKAEVSFELTGAKNYFCPPPVDDLEHFL